MFEMLEHPVRVSEMIIIINGVFIVSFLLNSEKRQTILPELRLD